MDAVRLLGAVLEDSPHNRQSMVQISGALLVPGWNVFSPRTLVHSLQCSLLRNGIIAEGPTCLRERQTSCLLMTPHVSTPCQIAMSHQHCHKTGIVQGTQV